jgi:hypothetical protein
VILSLRKNFRTGNNGAPLPVVPLEAGFSGF